MLLNCTMTRKITHIFSIDETAHEPNGGLVSRQHAPNASEAALALQRGDTSLTINILNCGFHPDSIVTQDTKAPALAWGISDKNPGFVKILIDHGANPNFQRLNTPNTYIAQTLMSLFDESRQRILANDLNYHGCPDEYEYSPREFDQELAFSLKPLTTILSHLLEAGADPNASCWLGQEKQNCLALHETIKNCDSENQALMIPIIKAFLNCSKPADPLLIDPIENKNAFELAANKPAELSARLLETLKSHATI